MSVRRCEPPPNKMPRSLEGFQDGRKGRNELSASRGEELVIVSVWIIPHTVTVDLDLVFLTP